MLYSIVLYLLGLSLYIQLPTRGAVCVEIKLKQIFEKLFFC